MRIMLVGDIQAHNWRKYPETNADGVNLRLLDIVNELDRLRKFALKTHVQALFVLGDVFEARNDLNVSVLNSIYRALRTWVQSGIRVVLLVGNHDRSGVGSEHSLEVFKSFCTVIDKPTTLNVKGGSIVLMPFMPDNARLASQIAAKVYPTTKLLLLHAAIKHFTLANGKEWGEGISLSDIPEHVTCVMGHYHR